MDSLLQLAHGFQLAFSVSNLLFAAVGVFIGTAVGVLPGIGPALTVALLLPVTFKLDPSGSLIMFAGIYYGGMYGGSTTAILLNTPGEAASVVTALEGNKMARAGRGGPALATAAIGSFVAALFATVGLAFLSPILVQVAVRFGPWDYFGLMLIAFVTVSATFGSSPLKGLTSLAFGLWLGLMGIDQLTGQARLTFGVPQLLDGVEVTTLGRGPVRHRGNPVRRLAPSQQAGKTDPGQRLAVDDQGGLEALVLAVDSRHADRLSDWCPARRRRRSAHLPQL